VDGLSRERAHNRGRLIRELLSAAVLGRVPHSVAASDLADLTPLLLRFGTGPLAWWAVRESPLAGDESALALRDAYRSAALRAAMAAAELERVFEEVGGAGLDPIIGKGWSVARAYPGTALRTYCDFDLYSRPRDHQRLLGVLARREPPCTYAVDAHQGLSYLDDRDLDRVFERSIQIPLGSTQIRVFGSEDHLRLICLHALAEGMTRPTWLCDIAWLVATVPANFDWDYFSAGSRRRADWCFAAIRLAHEVLGVDVSRVPSGAVRRPLPGWFARSMLAAWGRGPRSRGSRMAMDRVARTPGAIVRALLDRWPHPIEATVGVGGRIGPLPRLPYEIAEAARRTVGYLRRLR
jgi:hypothetical protein